MLSRVERKNRCITLGPYLLHPYSLISVFAGNNKKKLGSCQISIFQIVLMTEQVLRFSNFFFKLNSTEHKIYDAHQCQNANTC